MSTFWPRARTLCLVGALFVWFGCGVEAWRRGEWGEIAARPSVLLLRPWQALRAFVSRGGDEKLYFAYANLMLGRPADLDYVASKELGDRTRARARVDAHLRPGPGPRLPYRDFLVEYPPVPLGAMALAGLFADTLPGYRIAFGALMALFFFATAWLGARLATVPAEQVWRRLGWLALALGPILCQRFDLVPAALVALGFAGIAARRDRLAGLAFGVAVMAKLFPALVLAPLLAFFITARAARRARDLALAAAAGALVIALPFLLTAPGPFVRAVALYGARPLHFESLLGALVLAHDGAAAIVGSFGSHNVVTPPWLAGLADLGFFAGALALIALGARRGRALMHADWPTQLAALLRLGLASIAVILCTSKVLSPQFMIWLLPLAAVQPGDEGRRLFRVSLLVVALTHVFYPVLHGAALYGETHGLVALLARNAALVALAVVSLRGLVATRPRSAPAPRRGPPWAQSPARPGPG